MLIITEKAFPGDHKRDSLFVFLILLVLFAYLMLELNRINYVE